MKFSDFQTCERLATPEMKPDQLKYSFARESVPFFDYITPWEGFRGRRIDPVLWERYRMQVRESGGFDIDCFPGPSFVSRMYPVIGFKQSPERFEMLSRLCAIALSEYNTKHGKGYEVVDVEKVNEEFSAGYMYYITFQVKDRQAAGDGDAPTETFQAQVWTGRCEEHEVILCRPKPNKPGVIVSQPKTNKEKYNSAV